MVIIPAVVSSSLGTNVNLHDYYADRSSVGSGYECESCSRNQLMIKWNIITLNLGLVILAQCNTLSKTFSVEAKKTKSLQIWFKPLDRFFQTQRHDLTRESWH